MVDEQKRLAEVRERMSVLEDLIAKKRCSLQALRDEYKALDTEALQLEIEIQMAESGVSPDDTPAGYDPHEEGDNRRYNFNSHSREEFKFHGFRGQRRTHQQHEQPSQHTNSANPDVPDFLLKYADSLGIDITKEITSESILAAFRKACMMHHPDRGGDENVMKDINAQMAAWKERNQ